jgi:hypothetical protein
MELNYSFKNKLSKFGDTLIGTSGAGYIGFNLQSVPPTLPSTGFKLFANSSNALSWIGSNGFVRTFDGTTNTADRTYTLPNASGTFGLLESTQTWSGINSFNSTTGYINITNTTNLSSGAGISFSSNIGANAGQFSLDVTGNMIARTNQGAMYFDNFGTGTINFRTAGANIRMFISTNGNVGIGTFTDAGYKLDVNGTARISDKLSISTGTNKSTGIATLVSGTVTISTTAVKTESLVWVQYHGSTSTATSVLIVPTITDSTSFIITAITAGGTTTNVTDTNTVKWWIIN